MFKGLNRDWTSLPLRLVLGFGFVFHGYPKLFDAQHHDMFVGWLGQLGIPAPGFMSWLVGTVEFIGGLALIAGAFVTVVALLSVVNMLVALFTVHLGNGFNAMGPSGIGVEFPLLYIAGFLALIIGGAGALSVDGWLAERRVVATKLAAQTA
jgi:putative oxidoreductase